MAELNQDVASAKPQKIRSRKINSKVDLTAMVDLAFLLITFFMLTTSLSKPKSMSLTMPDPKGAPGKVDENRTMTILVNANNKAKCFMGQQSEPANEVTLGTNELRREIAKRKKQVHAYSAANDKPDGLIVIIKPSKQSNYGNLVDVLDEMAISDVQSYAIVE